MFGKTLKMELVRAFRPSKVILVAVLNAMLLFFSNFEVLAQMFQYGYDDTIGSVEQLIILMGFDTFKCVMVVLLAGLYTSSFCKDDNTHYLRMILARTDVTTYTQCRFIANLLVVVATSIVSLYVFILLMSPWKPLVADDVAMNSSYYYKTIVANYPILYVGMTGLVFGLVTTACSSLGMLYSAYKKNSFVSIAISGLIFYMALSYISYDSPFNVLLIVNMSSTLGREIPKSFMFLWANVYMLSVIGICGFLFWKRMKWRAENGFV